jgi:hypothetical protein
MKCFNITIFAFLISFLVSNKVLAQSDYLITEKNDTIRCELKVNSLGSYKYGVNKTDQFKNIDFHVKEYFFAADTTTLVSKLIPEKQSKLLVKWLERGKINLYEREVSTSNINNLYNVYYHYWYATKDNDSLVQIKTDAWFPAGSSRKKREQALTDMFADSPYLLKSFTRALKTQEYDYDLIRNYIQAYNLSSLANKKTKE